MGSTVCSISSSRTYGVADLKIDLANMYTRAGQRGDQISFLLTDTQITDEAFLVYINDLLASGDIPDLFAPDDKENIINSMRNECKAAGIADTNDNCYDFFISKVRDNLHVILCFSPVGESFRVRARRFPALVNNTVIDFFHPWPEDALQSVSQRFLGEVDLGTEEVAQAIINFMPISFGVVNKVSKDFLTEEKRYFYSTPKSFLELIALYKDMLSKKRDALLAAADRLQAGLDKLQKTAKSVGELEEQIVVMKAEVEIKINAAETLSIKVGAEKANCEEEGKKANEEAAKCEAISVEVTQKQADCEKDLAAALPAVGKAMAALDTITKKDLGELKALKKPPSGIDDVLATVLIMLSPPEGVVKDRSWGAAVKAMKDIDKFIKELKAFKEVIDREEVPPGNFRAVRPYLADPNFEADKISRKSKAAAGLCGWVINITMYFDIVSDVEPKKRLLAESEQQLKDANEKLVQVKQLVADLQEQLDTLEKEYAQVMQEKDDAVESAEKMASKLEMAQRLIKALESENVRWSENVESLQSDMELLPGDVLVTAAFISYVGAFNSVFRMRLIQNEFLPYIAEHQIPCSDNPDPVMLLSDEAEQAGWVNEGLPADRISIENGALVVHSMRWPLLIDPQLQGIVWVKGHEEQNNLLVSRLGTKGMMDKLERVIENGEPVFLEAIEESIDAALGPVVGRRYTKKMRKDHVKLGDKEVQVHADFKLYLHTKLSNPHYPPEIQAETTLVNFTVTIIA